MKESPPQLNSETTPEFLAFLSADEEWMTRALVAKHLNTSPETLNRLSKDTDLFVVNKVVQNPNTTTKTLEEILNRNDVSIVFKEDIFNHPNVTPEIYLKYFS
jgi:hypothetical protein